MAADQDSLSGGGTGTGASEAGQQPSSAGSSWLSAGQRRLNGSSGSASSNNNNGAQQRPLILITASAGGSPTSSTGSGAPNAPTGQGAHPTRPAGSPRMQTSVPGGELDAMRETEEDEEEAEQEEAQGAGQLEEQVEEVDGIKYRILAAVTKPPAAPKRALNKQVAPHKVLDSPATGNRAPSAGGSGGHAPSGTLSRLSSMRRKSSALVASLLHSPAAFLGPQSASSQELNGKTPARPRRLSIYELTKTPPPETSLEIYLSERRRSSTVSSKQVQQQLEQQSTFETNYCQRQQYFKDLNQKLINQDRKLLNVVANRGQIHRHSVDIAQLPLHSAQAQARVQQQQPNPTVLIAPPEAAEPGAGHQDKSNQLKGPIHQSMDISSKLQPRSPSLGKPEQPELVLQAQGEPGAGARRLSSARRSLMAAFPPGPSSIFNSSLNAASAQRDSLSGILPRKKSCIVIRKFQKLDQSELSSTPAPDVKIGQRVAYKEYYGNEFGTIRWIGRVPQICPDWTVGVEFDNAIGEGDGSLNGRRYFIAKDCFAKFLPLNQVALVDQHVGRPEPGTMISVMSAAVRPGQMISIQRVSTVHVQHCFLNAPHRRPGADILAVNTRLHCQCPNCGPCAHVIKPPRTQRLARGGKNATHMCQFSTYTCCGMESQEETMCTYTGNKVSSMAPPPVGNSWIEGAGYLTNLQAQQSKAMPEEYRLFGAAPEDVVNPGALRRLSRSSSRRGSGRNQRRHHKKSAGEHRQNNEASQIPQPVSTALNRNDYLTPNQAYTGAESPNQVDEIRTGSMISPYSPQSGSQSPRIVGESGDQQNTLACLDKQAAYGFDNLTGNKTMMTNSNSREGNEDNDLEYGHQWHDSAGNKIHTKGPRVVYRDSIENRYLFPTDEPIDSTLEADLENLSQARYGTGRNHSRANGGGPRNILVKSLRSLVSCLSAQSNGSELGGGSSGLGTDRYRAAAAAAAAAESTLEFSDQLGVSSRGLVSNKAMPQLAAKKKAFSQSGDFDSSSVVKASLKGAGEADDDFDYDYYYTDNVSPPSPNSIPKNDFIMTKNNSTFFAHGTNEQQQHGRLHGGGATASVNDFEGHHHHHHHHHTTVRRHISSSTDCGFSSASQNSINYLPCSPVLPTATAPGSAAAAAAAAEDERRSRQIYKRIIARLIASAPSVTNEDLQRLREVLIEPQHQHYESCCLHNGLKQMPLNTTAGAISSPDSEKIIADIIQKSYLNQTEHCEQLFQSATTISAKGCSGQMATCCPTTNYCLEMEVGEVQQQQQKHALPSERHKKMNETWSKGAPAADDKWSVTGQEHQQQQPEATEGFQTGAQKLLSSSRSLVDGPPSSTSSTPGSATFSSSDSFYAASGAITGPEGGRQFESLEGADNSCAEARRKNRSKQISSSGAAFSNNTATSVKALASDIGKSDGCTKDNSLPKAFELKLTLSINSDSNNKSQQMESPRELDNNSTNAQLGQPISANILPGKALNSTFNINIVSNLEEDPSEKVSPTDASNSIISEPEKAPELIEKEEEWEGNREVKELDSVNACLSSTPLGPN